MFVFPFIIDITSHLLAKYSTYSNFMPLDVRRCPYNKLVNFFDNTQLVYSKTQRHSGQCSAIIQRTKLIFKNRYDRRAEFFSFAWFSLEIVLFSKRKKTAQSVNNKHLSFSSTIMTVLKADPWIYSAVSDTKDKESILIDRFQNRQTSKHRSLAGRMIDEPWL